jgi:hypothetical protein
MGMKTALSPTFVSLLVPFALACRGKVDETFPPGLDPLREASLAWPGEGADCPEELNIDVSGDNKAVTGEARGCIHGDIADVWEAFGDADTVVDRRAATVWSVEYDTEPDYEVSYEIDMTVEDIIDVDYLLAWRHGRVDAEDGSIELRSRWQKVGGTEYVYVLEGSIVTTELAPGVVGVEVIENLEGALVDTSYIEEYVNDLYESLLAVAHGEELPSW